MSNQLQNKITNVREPLEANMAIYAKAYFIYSNYQDSPHKLLHHLGILYIIHFILIYYHYHQMRPYLRIVILLIVVVTPLNPIQRAVYPNYKIRLESVVKP